MVRAKFPGECPGGDRIRPGDLIEARDDGGWQHTMCRATPKSVPVAAYVEGDPSDWEAAEGRRERERMNAEYAAGVNDAHRWQENRQMFGQEAADAIEFDRDMRGLNGDW